MIVYDILLHSMRCCNYFKMAGGKSKLRLLFTISAHIEPRGSIFQNEFLGGVLLIFDLGGVVIKMGFY